MWERPLYRLKAKNKRFVDIDVTTSCSPGLKPNKALKEVITFLKRHDLEKVLDFGAGSLRHTLPLIRSGFEVTAVEFKEQFDRPFCKKALARARKSGNFTALIFPKPFIKDRRKFDAALISFVVPTMPVKKERDELLRVIGKKLKGDSVIFWMSQYGKYAGKLRDDNRVADGWYLNPSRSLHSFYTEFTIEKIDAMLKKIRFERIRSPSKSGHDQFRLYSRGEIKWP
jgi:hypothetical protein